MRTRLALTVLVAIGMIAPAAAAPMVPQANSPAQDATTPASTQTASDSGSAAGSGGGAADAANYTKLYVDDNYAHLRIKPGESESFAVTVQNAEDEAVEVSPHLAVPQLRQRPVEEDWVSIDGGNVTLDAGEEREFTVTVSVPEDAELGRYQGSVAFTEETIVYPGRPAQPVHAASFNVQVWKEPTVEIVSGDYLHSRIEAGDSYTHTVVVENSGDKPVPLNPQVTTDRRVRTSADDDGVDRSWFEIDAPNEVQPGESATVEMTISPPADAELNRYRTELDLGLKDPARPDDNDYWQQISLRFQVWKQPAEPFESSFTVSEEATSVALELSAADRRLASASEPASFDVAFVAPNGTTLEAERVRSTTRGAVDLSGDERRDAATDSAYSTRGERQTFTYRIDDPDPGAWTVRIMPENTMRFEYEIVRDESG